MQRDSAGPRRDPVTEPGTPTTSAGFRLAVVPGVNPARWVRVWHERLPDVRLSLVQLAAGEAEAALRSGRVDAGLVRMPVDRDVLSAIPLYTETTVVVVPTDHVVVAADEVVVADLVEEVHLVPADDVLSWDGRPGTGPRAATTGAGPGGADEPAPAGAGTGQADRTVEATTVPPPATTADAVELVAAGVGVLVVPQSLARLHHRRDLTYRPVTDAPTSSVALAWVTAAASDLVEELVGIVRGRTANSSRGRGTGAEPTAPGAGRGSAGRAGGTDAGAGGSGGASGRARGGTPPRSGGGRRPRRPGGRGGAGRPR